MPEIMDSLAETPATLDPGPSGTYTNIDSYADPILPTAYVERLDIYTLFQLRDKEVLTARELRVIIFNRYPELRQILTLDDD